MVSAPSFLPDYANLRTAVLLIDPYNDVLAGDGQHIPMVGAVASAAALHANLRLVLGTVRAAGLPVVIVPHHSSRPEGPDGGAGDKAQGRGACDAAFAPQPGDLIATEYWTNSGFANTNLNMLLTQRGITHLILIGLIANTCIEGTGKYATKLGYHVTLVRDATAAASGEQVCRAPDNEGQLFADIITTTAALATALDRQAA
jgi:nicotinamidase-related amidase